ncbi:MAG TPA: peptidoglycan-binding protein [Clostridia bacterium]|nr:peptidoglycan-binding protein [Clostridia bacterium]
MRYGRIAGIVLALFVLGLCCCASAEETGTVTASALVLRTGPGMDYDRICDIPNGAALVLLSYDASGWYRVGYDGRIGYAFGRYVRVAETWSTERGELPDVTALIAAGNNPSYPTVMKPGDVGSSVSDLQNTLAALGYPMAADGDYGQGTVQAVQALQKTLGLTADGVVGAMTRRSIGKTGEPVELLDWWKGGNTAFPRFSTAKVVDVATGLSFTVWRYGGDSHYDVEPFTAQDTATLKTIYNGERSWDRRAVWVVLDGRVVAGSMNGMPHDGYRIAENGFGGHFCIHLFHSRVHVSDTECPLHQAAVLVAYTTKYRP